MTRKLLVHLWRAAALLALALAFVSCGERAAAPEAAAPVTHPTLFYDDVTFFASVREASTLPAPQGPVAGGIIPHDWLGGRYIAWLFQSLAAGDPPDTVILVGPNHDNEGRPGTLTSSLGWSTPFGAVAPNSEKLDALVSRGIVSVDDAVLTTEHSVAGIMPAIAYYLPDTKVVPLVLRGDASPEHTLQLAAALAAELDDDTVLVAAVDFSHDLVHSEAARNNTVTLDALRAGDSAALFTLDNRFLDSPESISVLMEAMSSSGAGPFVLTADTSSAALRGDELAPTTSYLVGYWRSHSWRWRR